MTPIADMIERMHAEGVQLSVIVLAVRTLETVTTRHDAVTTPSRSKEAERAARYRENIKQNKGKAEANDAANPPLPSVTRAPTLLTSLSLNLEGTSEEGSKEKKEEDRSMRARGQRMVSGAILTDQFREAAIMLGAAPARVEALWAEFVDYWVAVPGSRGVKLDWLATWRNNMRKSLERGSGNGIRKQSLSDLAGDMAEQARRWERENGVSRPAGSV